MKHVGPRAPNEKNNSNLNRDVNGREQRLNAEWSRKRKVCCQGIIIRGLSKNIHPRIADEIDRVADTKQHCTTLNPIAGSSDRCVAYITKLQNQARSSNKETQIKWMIEIHIAKWLFLSTFTLNSIQADFWLHFQTAKHCRADPKDCSKSQGRFKGLKSRLKRGPSGNCRLMTRMHP